MEAGGGDQEESEGSPAPGQGLGWASHKERPLLSGIDTRILKDVPGFYNNGPAIDLVIVPGKLICDIVILY